MCEELENVETVENDRFWESYEEDDQTHKTRQIDREQRTLLSTTFEHYVKTHPELEMMINTAKKNDAFLLWKFHDGPEFVYYFSQGGDEDWICLSPNHNHLPLTDTIRFNEEDLYHSYSTSYGTITVKTHS